MKNIILLAFKSFRNRKFSVALTIISIALSVTLLVGVERIRTQSHASFMNTISGTDLVVGARSGPIQLLLYSVFRIGDATNNISWQSYREIAGNKAVRWAVPISLGDSHKGYRVMGTSGDYFLHFKYGDRQALKFSDGVAFADLYDAVLGAEVAAALGYQLGDPIVLAHGAGKVSFADHADKPFRVAGILAPTGTPVDRTVHVKLEGIEAIHIGWESGTPSGGTLSVEQTRMLKLKPTEITAFMLKLKSPLAIFKLQRLINEYRLEPLTAIMPGVALQQLWELIGVAESALLVVSAFVVVVGLFGMLTALLTSLKERRREMAILRSVGARPVHIFMLLIGEATLMTSIGISLGVGLLYALLLLAQPLLIEQFGFYFAIGGVSSVEVLLLSLVWLAGLMVGVVPAWRIYYLSLVDGMSIRT